MDKTEKRKVKMNRLAELFGAKSGEKVGSSCSGKWAGTTDYYVKFNNGFRYHISNGLKKFDENLDDLLSVYSGFAEKKTEILSILREMEQADNALAAENGLKSYHVIDIDYMKNDHDYIGWFYAIIEVDGIKMTIRETNLHYGIKNYSRDRNTEVFMWDKSSKYHVAGGVEKPVFVWHGYGFDMTSYALR